MVKLILITNGDNVVREAVEQIISDTKKFEFDLSREEITGDGGHKVYIDELDVTNDEVDNIFDILSEDIRTKSETLRITAYLLEDTNYMALHKFEYGTLDTPVKFKPVIEIESHCN